MQSIPAVYALSGGKVVDGFIGAQGEAAVKEFVDRLMPSDEEQAIAAWWRRATRRRCARSSTSSPTTTTPSWRWPSCWPSRSNGDTDEALALLGRIPETPETRRVAALARTGAASEVVDDEITGKLDALLDRVKADDEARQEYVDLLEVLGPDDPRTADYRKRLTARLF